MINLIVTMVIIYIASYLAITTGLAIRMMAGMKFIKHPNLKSRIKFFGLTWVLSAFWPWALWKRVKSFFSKKQ